MSLAVRAAGGPFLAIAFCLSPAFPGQEPPQPAEVAKPAGPGVAVDPGAKALEGIPVFEAGPQGPVPIPRPPAAREEGGRPEDEATVVYELKYFNPSGAVATLKEVLGIRGPGPVPSSFGPDFRAAELPDSRVVLSGRFRMVDQAVRLLRIVDRAPPASGHERHVAIYDIRNSDARSVSEILKGIARGDGGFPTKVLTDARTNKIIVETYSAQDLHDIEMLIKELDVAVEIRPIPVSTRIVLLKVARAEEIAALVQSLKGSDGGPGRAGPPRRISTVSPEGEVRIVVDGRMNSLIIEAPEAKMASILDLIQQLDVPARTSTEAIKPSGEKVRAEPPGPEAKAEKTK
jgi:type II secretory pathway component GspD/PulD (secretin)